MVEPTSRARVAGRDSWTGSIRALIHFGIVAAGPTLLLGLFVASGWSAEPRGADRPRSSLVTKPGKAAAETARNPLNDLKQWVERNAALREVSDRQRDHESIRMAFREVIKSARTSTVRILADDLAVAFGTIVSEDGLVLTKASELRGQIKCVLSDKRTLPAKIVMVKPEHDLALLRLDGAEKFTPIEWSDESPAVGNFLATPGPGELPTAIGVLSVTPRRIAAAIGFLGVGLDQARPRVTLIQPGSSADKAGLQVDDLVLRVNGEKIDNRESLQQLIRKYPPGEKVELQVRRGEHEFKVVAILGDLQTGLQQDRVDFQNRLGGGLSTRRAGFDSVLQHDTVLNPNECGGPIIDLDGKAIGVNIARAGRVASYAIPANVVRPLVERMIVDEARENNLAKRPATEPVSNKAGG